MLLFGLASTEQSDDPMDVALNGYNKKTAKKGSQKVEQLHSIAEHENHAAEKLLDDCLKGIAEGKSDALAKLYSQTDKAVFGFALSILKNYHDAEDVLHDTYIKIWQYAGSYSSRSKPMAWILTITRNLALSGLRSKKYTADIDEQGWVLFSEKNELLTVDDRITLDAVLNRLKDDERQIIMLYCEAGLKHREIAQLLGMPLSTVLSKYNRSIKKLKLLLEMD